jgi:calcium/calmodulin-dependent protein kinase I
MSADYRHTEADFKERYLLGRVLGSGTFSTVRLAVDRFTGTKWACKIVTEQAERELLLREVEILQQLDHPNILKYREHFSTTKNLYIITELLKGTDLRAAVMERGSYAEDDAREIVRQILSALSYLDSKGVAHRDLKMENIMFSPPTASDRQIKIIDFGLAGQLSDNAAAFREAYGTPLYLAPEVASGMPYGTSCDVWAAGVILFVLLSGDFPFCGDSINELVESICHSSLRFADPVWELTSSGAKHMVHSLLTGNPAKRVTAKEAAMHPWLTQ